MAAADAGGRPARVLALDGCLGPAERVWGTGGWLPPEQREALDWLTLLRLCGWGTDVTRPEALPPIASEAGGPRWIAVAGAPERVPEAAARWLGACLAAGPVLVVAQVAERGSPLAGLAGVARGGGRVAGRALRWTGPGGERRWGCPGLVEGQELDPGPEAACWATLDGAPLIAARRVGQGVVATVGCHPSALRDAGGGGTALLRHLLVWGHDRAVAWLDWEGCLVLRMDDPGGAQNVHSRSWHHAKLAEADWAGLGAELARHRARLSIAYVAGWVDDGDAARGSLRVGGVEPVRTPGAVHPSPLVRYLDRAGHGPGTVHDYASEYRGIRALRRAGLAEVELHGYTHLHPDASAWSAAPDRYDAVSWYRELGPAAARTLSQRAPDQHPLALGCAALERHFGVRPGTLISPGDEWTNAVLERALALGLDLVDSYYLALRHGGRWCWAQHVCAPYLDAPAPAWFDAGLPVVGYFHDRDVALEGVGWMGRLLDRWRDAGASRVIDFRELAGALSLSVGTVDAAGAGEIDLAGTPDRLSGRGLSLRFRGAGGAVPPRCTIRVGGRSVPADVTDLGGGVGGVRLDPFPGRPT